MGASLFCHNFRFQDFRILCPQNEIFDNINTSKRNGNDENRSSFISAKSKFSGSNFFYLREIFYSIMTTKPLYWGYYIEFSTTYPEKNVEYVFKDKSLSLF